MIELIDSYCGGSRLLIENNGFSQTLGRCPCMNKNVWCFGFSNLPWLPRKSQNEITKHFSVGNTLGYCFYDNTRQQVWFASSKIWNGINYRPVLVKSGHKVMIFL